MIEAVNHKKAQYTTNNSVNAVSSTRNIYVSMSLDMPCF